MTDFSKIIEQAKNLQSKMKESQEKIKQIQVEGVSGGGAIKIILNGDGEIVKINISPTIIKEDISIIEDLIMAAHNNAKLTLKSKTSEELSSMTGGVNLPEGFKWPF
ncbi:MAG: YbaB/EbfC family nucleoid-associated protein [Candidatus Pelagibacterales bacterium]|nr:MAG: YbaB/EbfC family nucleoid-associated protein [Pelagibacteraceae bacterium TMED233]RZO63284.1 MAG: YbaB/EbfC family nucleoid-associated protein [Pelagibacterales bacterium]|tara:strand:+ start:8352 stop:8672 length:321 start_codon:yes stop_codon:yes gene_type:complete